MYYIGLVESYTSNKLIGRNTTFSAFKSGDTILIDNKGYLITEVINDVELTLNTTDIILPNTRIYVSSKIQYYEYKIIETEYKITMLDTEYMGVKSTTSGTEKIEFSDKRTALSELLKLRDYYQTELDKLKNEEQGLWIMRRFEYGTY